MSRKNPDCPYNGMIDCADRSKCSRCGWNPDVEEYRKQQLADKGAKALLRERGGRK